MAKKNKEDCKKAGRRGRGGFARLILRGQLMDSEFFKKNWMVFAIVVVISLAYITNKYNHQTKMEEERMLTEELEVVKAERIRMRSLYMGRIRESSMQRLVDSLHLGLSVQDQPPVKLSSSKK